MPPKEPSTPSSTKKRKTPADNLRDKVQSGSERKALENTRLEETHDTEKKQKLLIEKGHAGPKRREGSGKKLEYGEVGVGVKKSNVYDTWGRGRKSCKGVCGKFIPSASKNDTCVTTGNPISLGAHGEEEEVVEEVGEEEEEAGEEEEVAGEEEEEKEVCVHVEVKDSASKNDTCVTTGNPISLGAHGEEEEVVEEVGEEEEEAGEEEEVAGEEEEEKEVCVHVEVKDSASKNDTCVTTGKPISLTAHGFSEYPGCDAKDIGKKIQGVKNEPMSIVTEKRGERTGETLMFPDYSCMVGHVVVKRVAMLRVGTLVNSKKKAYAVSLVLEGVKVTTVLADELEKFASDAELFKMYGHVTTWIGAIEEENVVLMEHIRDFPIANAYYADISNFIPQKTLEIGNVLMTRDDYMRDSLKLSLGGWKNDGTEVAVSGTVFTFGDEDGKNDLRMIVLTPILTMMTYASFSAIKPCSTDTDINLLSSLRNSELLKIHGYSDVGCGWTSKLFLKEFLLNMLRNNE